MKEQNTTNQNQTDNEARKKLYEQYVREANDRIKSNQEGQDKMILTLSASLFGLLSIFLKEVPNTCYAIVILFLLSGLTLITLTSTLFSFYCCKKGNIKDIHYAYKYYIEEKEKYFDKESLWSRIGNICNNVALISFTLLLIAYIVMVCYYFIIK
ncbi:hypothetical protein [Helicobacter sp. 10-6591]|uniref:hypothetical protein n=1 Tax=Helicobacter sp. 10-6591 TaxID=2004998 RepID=UPI000DCDFC17|nr:hypothetical protein [Helicobacter sp. 10-6591]RAX52031.1 hypothetical protein CCY97_07895 [Helicobacter sp. 10-6591]